MNTSKRGPKPKEESEKKTRVEIFVVQKAVSKLGRSKVKSVAEDAVMKSYLGEIEP